MSRLTIWLTLTRDFQFGSPHNGFKPQAPLLILFVLTLFQVLLTIGNTHRITEPVMPHLVLFSLTQIFGWRELLNRIRAVGTQQTVWVEDQTTITLLFWQTLKSMTELHSKLALKDFVLDNCVYLKILQMSLHTKLLMEQRLFLYQLHLLLTLVKTTAKEINQML